MLESPPRRLGDFEIIRELGRGGMGIVFEARQVSLNRNVALKVLSAGLGLTSKAVERFRREAEAAARLHHTNIVPIYATGESEGTHFYAMELIDGPSLDHVIGNMLEGSIVAERKSVVEQSGQPSGQTAPLVGGADLGATGPYVEKSVATTDATSLTSSSLNSGSQYFDRVARMIADVADALEHAHQNGVIHRDIKPSNLLLSSAGRLSVNDFGLARMLEQPGMTMTGEFVGTPAYMSPEQIAAGRAPLNHRTDIYSLGATLYELLTLQRPFRGERRDETIAQIMHKEPKAPRKVNAKVPVDLETICLKCMEKDPDRRYQTAGKLAEDLRCYVNRFAISARRAGPVQRLVKWVKRRPGIATAAACSLILAAAAALFALQAWESSRKLLFEKQQRALEKATLAAMAGKFDEAEAAIKEAGALGASKAQIRLLDGQVLHFRGDSEKAVTVLKTAVEFAPESAAAQAMLTMAYISVGDFANFSETMQVVNRLAPETAQDYIFKGWVQVTQDTTIGLDTLNAGIKKHGNSPLARMVRADVHSIRAEERSELDAVEKSLADLRAAKEEMGDNPQFLAFSINAHLVAANLYRAANRQTEAAEALKQAKSSADALAGPGESLPNPAFCRIMYFEQTENYKEAREAARRAAEKSGVPILAFMYAQLLCRSGEAADRKQALQLLEARKSIDPRADLLRACILAELHPKGEPRPALAVYDEMKRGYKSGWGAVEAQNVLRLVGDKNGAQKAVLALRQSGVSLNTFHAASSKHVLDYYCDDREEKRYLKWATATGSAFELSYAHYAIGLTHLADGRIKTACDHFGKSLQGGLIYSALYPVDRVLVHRMKDKTWPTWIENKDREKP